METELYKIRSTRACFRAAYDLFCTNLSTIIKKTWLPMLVLSAVGCLCYVIPWMSNSHGADDAEKAKLLVANMAMGLGWAIATLVASVWAVTGVVCLLNGQTKKVNAPRVARATVIETAAAILTAATATALSLIPFLRAGATQAGVSETTLTLSGAIMVGTTVVWGIALLPMAYSITKYLMEPSAKVGIIVGSAYRQGWHRWGFLFGCALLCLVICSLFMVIVKAPENILLMAQLADNTGRLMGDASELPAHYAFMTYVLGTLCTFIWCYLMTWVGMVFYYAYGSMEAQKKETTLTTTH